MQGQSGWTRILTPTGRFEYQFQGSGPAVRNGQYQQARDYQFLVMDEEGWLYRIPVRVAADAEKEVPDPAEVLRVAEAQLRHGLGGFKPRRNAPYQEMDQAFAVDVDRMEELRKELSGSD